MRAHISINVSNVPESVAFYRRVFGVEPQKQTDTYAKFDLKNPSLNFAMQSGGDLSRVSHFGIEVDSREEVRQWEKRLQAQGLLHSTEGDVACCYARQDKAWFTDPDGNEWEVFYVHEQLPLNSPESPSSCCA